MINDLLTATLETLEMTFISLVFSYLLGLPIAFLFVETKRDGLFPNRYVNKVLDVVIAIGRAIPFIILMVLILPFTRWLVGTGIGTVAVIVPLSVAATPFVARVVEQDLIRFNC